MHNTFAMCIPLIYSLKDNLNRNYLWRKTETDVFTDNILTYAKGTEIRYQEFNK